MTMGRRLLILVIIILVAILEILDVVANIIDKKSTS